MPQLLIRIAGDSDRNAPTTEQNHRSTHSKAARVEALLLEGLDSGEPIEATDDWWEQKRTQLMQRQSNLKK